MLFYTIVNVVNYLENQIVLIAILYQWGLGYTESMVRCSWFLWDFLGSLFVKKIMNIKMKVYWRVEKLMNINALYPSWYLYFSPTNMFFLARMSLALSHRCSMFSWLIFRDMISYAEKNSEVKHEPQFIWLEIQDCKHVEVEIFCSFAFEFRMLK
jgi:hypothetical protein